MKTIYIDRHDPLDVWVRVEFIVEKYHGETESNILEMVNSGQLRAKIKPTKDGRPGRIHYVNERHYQNAIEEWPDKLTDQTPAQESGRRDGLPTPIGQVESQTNARGQDGLREGPDHQNSRAPSPPDQTQEIDRSGSVVYI